MDKIQNISGGATNYIRIKNNGLFYVVSLDDAILVSYLFNLDIKNGLVYLVKNKIDYILLVLDKLNINYLYNNIYHEFINNKYDYYYLDTLKKYDLNLIINGVYQS